MVEGGRRWSSIDDPMICKAGKIVGFSCCVANPMLMAIVC